MTAAKGKFDSTDALVFGGAALLIGLIALLRPTGGGGSVNVLTANSATTSALLSEAESYNQNAAAVAIAQAEYATHGSAPSPWHTTHNSPIGTGPAYPGHPGLS